MKAKQRTKTEIGYLSREIFYKDPYTGEMVSVGDATLYTDTRQRSRGFLMLWPKNFLKGKTFEIKFFLWLLHAMRGNYIIQTDEQLAKLFKCSRQRIERLKKKLKEDNIIKYRNGVIMVNPNLIWQGNVQGRMTATAYYLTFDKNEAVEPDE